MLRQQRSVRHKIPQPHLRTAKPPNAFVSSHIGSLEEELHALLALLLNTFIFGSWHANLGLGSRSELEHAINERAAELAGGLFAEVRWSDINLVYVIRDSLDIVDKWVNRSLEEPFALKDDPNQLINREQALSRILLTRMVERYCHGSLERDFLVGLIDGVGLKSVIDGYSYNYTIWHIMRETLKKSQQTGPGHRNVRKDARRHSKTARSSMNRLSAIDNYPPLEYKDVAPMLRLASSLTLITQYPILYLLVTLAFQMLISVPILNTLLRRLVYSHILRVCEQSETVLAKLVHKMTFTMYPNLPQSNKWGLKPRYVPQDDAELVSLRAECVQLLTEKLQTSSSRWKWLVVDGTANGDAELAERIVALFEDKHHNKTLLWSLLLMLSSHVLGARVNRVQGLV